MFLLGAVLWLRGRARWRGAAAASLSAALLAACVTPWSLAATKVLNDSVLTTTSVPLSLGVTFGEPDRLCFGPCTGRGEIWAQATRYSRAVAGATGMSELDVQEHMSTYARAGLTPRQYAATVLDNYGRYVFNPTEFEQQWRPSSRADGTSYLVTTSSTAVYYAFLLGLAAALLLIVTSRFREQVVSLLVKVMACALMLQPFIHLSSGRYWPLFAPMMGIAAGLLWQLAADRRTPAEQHETAYVAAARTMTVAQLCLCVATVGVVAVLLILGT